MPTGCAVATQPDGLPQFTLPQTEAGSYGCLRKTGDPTAALLGVQRLGCAPQRVLESAEAAFQQRAGAREVEAYVAWSAEGRTVGESQPVGFEECARVRQIEIGKIDLDKTFEERESLNINIVNAINMASEPWGVQVMRYEIKDITPPENVRHAMELQVAAERQKRAEILNSEGKRQSQINIAEGGKRDVVLQSEAALTDQVNRAKGEAEAILAVARATAEGIELVAASIQKSGGEKAVALKLAEQYIDAFSNLAKETNTVLLPEKTGDIGSMVAQALAVFNKIQNPASPEENKVS